MTCSSDTVALIGKEKAEDDTSGENSDSQEDNQVSINGNQRHENMRTCEMCCLTIIL